MLLTCPDSAKGKGTTERHLPMGRKGTTSGQKGHTSGQEALGKGNCQWAERAPPVGRQLWAKAKLTWLKTSP